MLGTPLIQLALTAVFQPCCDGLDRLLDGAGAQAGGLRLRGADGPGSLVALRKPERELGPGLDARLLELVVSDPAQLGVARGFEKLAHRRLADRGGAVEGAGRPALGEVEEERGEIARV